MVLYKYICDGILHGIHIYICINFDRKMGYKEKKLTLSWDQKYVSLSYSPLENFKGQIFVKSLLFATYSILHVCDF